MHPPRWILSNRSLEILISKPYRWLAKKMHHRYSVVKRHGLFFLADMDSVVGRHLYSRGFWEFRQIEFLESETKTLQKQHAGDWHFVDVGANCGIYSLYFSKSGLFSRIIAFEPDKNNLIEMRLNMLMNKDKKIELNDVGLSDSNGTAKLKDDEGVGSTLDFESTGDESTQDVSIRRFDDMFQIEGKFLVVKIDVEGHELSALAGMTRTLSNNKCVLQVESWNKFDDVNRELGKLGYANFHSFGIGEYDYYFKNF